MPFFRSIPIAFTIAVGQDALAHLERRPLPIGRPRRPHVSLNHMDTLAAGLITIVILIVFGAVVAFAVGLPAPVSAPSRDVSARPARRSQGWRIYPLYIWAAGILVAALVVYLVAQPLWVIFVVHRERPASDFRAEQTFSRTCDACHGDKGFGVRITPYLSRDDLAIRLGLDPANPQHLSVLSEYVKLMVSDGHGMMPAWSEEKGGPLTSEQIQALVDLIIEDRVYQQAR